MPDGLQLEERRDLVQALRVGRAVDDPLDVLGRRPRSRSARRPSAPVRSIAFTSMCDASHGASSARRPVSRLTTPPGRSLVASTSASSIAASGPVSDAIATTVLPPTSAGASRETRPSSGGSSGAIDRDDAGRLGHGEVEVRPRDRVRRAEHLRELVGEARVPDPAVDRALDLVAAGRELGELRRARLHHLGDPVEHLAAVVGGRPRPLRLRRARGDDGVAHVLARGARDVLPLGLVGAPRLRARERAADVELVRLLDRQPSPPAAGYGVGPGAAATPAQPAPLAGCRRHVGCQRGVRVEPAPSRDFAKCSHTLGLRHLSETCQTSGAAREGRRRPPPAAVDFGLSVVDLSIPPQAIECRETYAEVGVNRPRPVPGVRKPSSTLGAWI